MGRKIKTSASALNIRLHPHTNEIYKEWLLSIFELGISVQLRGDRYGIVSFIDENLTYENAIIGVITTYTKIDKDGEWFNTNNFKNATIEEISEISIPSNLFPNAASFYFYFDLNKHKLYFQTYNNGKTFSVNFAYKLFERLAHQIILSKEIKLAKISVVQDHKSIKAMFSLPVIKSVKFTLLRPNPEISNPNFELDIEAHMAETNSREMEIEYKAESGETIETDNIMDLGIVASENGKVVVSGRNESGAVTLSSDNFPKTVQGKYDPENVSHINAFINLIRNFF